MANPLGSAPGVILGVGLGAAASTAITPVVEPARQEAWLNNQHRILDPATYAALVAQGGIDLAAGETQASRNGFNKDKFDALVYLAQRAPTYGEAQDLRRRDKISHEQLLHSFAKAQVERQYWDALADLVDDRLSAQAVALGIIRSMIADPGFFPVQLDTSGGVVPSYPVSGIDPIQEAAASGFNEERLRVMVGSIGRPPGPGELARALFREIIERPDFNRGILEGDTRPEWADPFLEVNREILTASQYAELELRGFYDRPVRLRNTAKHGMSDADSDLLLDLQGRSVPVHQVTTGLARGGAFPGDYANVPEPYRAAIQRSNIRREWAELAYANRYSYPSGFQIRGEAQAGDLSEAETERILLEVGWSPHWAKFFATAWTSKATVAKADPYVGKAQTQLWTAIHKKFEKGTIDSVTADSALTNLVPNAADRAYILTLWETELNLGAPAQPPP